MSGFTSLIRGGFAVTTCAVMSVGIAHASPTFHSMLSDDLVFASEAGVLPPLHKPEEMEPAAGVVTYPSEGPGFRSFSRDLVDSDIRPATLALPSLRLTDRSGGTIQIDAGQIEAIEGWTGLLQTPIGWRAPGDRSAGEMQSGIFSALSQEQTSTETRSYVSVIPLPAAFTSAGVTIGLIGAAWVFRRVRAMRSTH